MSMLSAVQIKHLKEVRSDFKHDLVREGHDFDMPIVEPQDLWMIILFWGSAADIDAETLFADAHGICAPKEDDEGIGSPSPLK